MQNKVRLVGPAALVSLLVLLVPVAQLIASAPTFWTVSTQQDFLKGDVENLSIDSDGRVFLGPEATQVAETAAPFIWSIASGPDGTLWAGTGNEGQVLRITRDGKVSTFFDAQEIEVHALAPAPNGGLYVGTSPDGKIYKVDAAGKAQTFFDPDDKYIWALAVAHDGTVYAATGEKGVIYRITPDGSGSVFYKTSSTNVVSLAIDRDGNVLAGTESPGRVFRIGKDGKAFVLLDSPFKEIHALRLADDGVTLYAAAFSGAPGGEDRPPTPVVTTPDTSAPSRAPVPTVTTEVTAISVVDASGAAGTSGATPREPRSHNAKGAIYRIQRDGLWDTVWEALDDWPFDLLIEKDGALLVGTGKEGKLFRVSGEPARATLLARASARQITTLLRDGTGRVIAGTSNPGKIIAIASSRAQRGTFDSDIRDAGTVATWGAIHWHASGKASDIEISTRSGNTATPDDTWSPWSKPYAAAVGEPIVSPKARYLQWRAVLKADAGDTTGPVLTSVTAAYLPRNLRPSVSSITVHPPGTVFQRPFSTGELEIAGFEDNTSDNRSPTSQAAAASATPVSPSPALGRKVYQKGLQTFVWKADDDNDDRLQYDILYRREGDTAWKPLKRGLWDPIFVWDTTSVPDGTYYVKIVASDAPSNSPATALTGEMESVSFDVDNTAPAIQVESAARNGAKTTLKFQVKDDQSAIQRVEYSFDASRWQVAYPVDGIADSRIEQFEILVDAPEATRSVIIRASDAMNNVATAVAPLGR